MMLQDGSAGPHAPEPTAEISPNKTLKPELKLEFLLHPDDLTALSRLPRLVRAGPSCPVRLLWYDDDALSHAAKALSLLRDGALWRVDRLEPNSHHDWPACTPTPTLSQADDPPLSDVVSVSAFDGFSLAYSAGQATISVLHGMVRGVVESRPACRLTLTGPAASLAALLPTLSAIRLSVPRASTPPHALAVARDAPLSARPLGAPGIGGEIPISDGLTIIISHLLDTLLYWTDTFRIQRDPEAIHQARVATRRLRSALSIYAPVAPCAELAAAAAALKQCASALGAARDWDVFLAGTGASLAMVSGRDPRIALLLRAAARRRDAVCTELAHYLDGPDFRHLELSLGTATVLRPWDTSGPLHAQTGPFAITVLTRRLKQIRRRGRGFDALSTEMLHEVRKDCKRLRYAAEFFAPAFPARRTRPFLRRLSTLQEELGTLNDNAASAQLMAQLGKTGRGYAGGVVDGMAAASALSGRASVLKSWKRFKQADPFWR